MYIIYYLLPLCASFILKPKIINTKIYSNNPTLWNVLSNNFKDTARNWFIKRAENKGIDWNNIKFKYEKDNSTLIEIYNNINNNSILYPEYYTRPFHGYDEGNLNWMAAYEGEAATLSMAVNYWKNVDPIITEKWLRYNVSYNIQNYIKKNQIDYPKSILDVGCSIGISTEYLYYTFPECKNINGIDLSPYFISIATYRANKYSYPINYYHKKAEEPYFKKKFDLIVCNFLLHEVPKEDTENILKSLYKILNNNGIIAVVDLDPKNIKDNLIVNNFRKWAFEVTEPHIYEYYNSNMTLLMESSGLKNVNKISNDPINSIWIGYK